jgi:hypothetical protein
MEKHIAHFNPSTVSDIMLCENWSISTVFNIMFHSKLPLQILSLSLIEPYSICRKNSDSCCTLREELELHKQFPPA